MLSWLYRRRELAHDTLATHAVFHREEAHIETTKRPNGDGAIWPRARAFSRTNLHQPPPSLTVLHNLASPEPPVGFEPTTARLRIESSTTELRWRNVATTSYSIGREVYAVVPMVVP